MAEAQLAERVDTLENYMKELSYQALKTEMEVARLSTEMREFKDEMREFKNEMRGFKDEMREFKDEMRGFKDEMCGFKDEMREFKDEMCGFKEEMRLDRSEMNRRWGELANKMGTLAEDIVAPNLPRLARELFRCEQPEFYAVRVKKQRGGETREYDVIVACEGYVLVNETKSSLRSRDVDEMVAILEEFREFFPEYAGRRLVGIIASLYVDESIIRLAASKGILVMAMGEETMQVFNREAMKTY
jgi:chromosome segregation ATPase